MSTATTIEISSAFVNVMDLTVAFSERATNTILPNGNVYIPPSDVQTTIQYSSNLKSLSNLGTYGIVSREEPGKFSTVSIGEGLLLASLGGPTSGGVLFVEPSITAASKEIRNELLEGIDGIRTVFQTIQNHVVGSVCLYYNGIRTSPENFTTDGTNIEITTFVPQVGDYVLVDYLWT